MVIEIVNLPIYPLTMVIFHSYVSLPEGKGSSIVRIDCQLVCVYISQKQINNSRPAAMRKLKIYGLPANHKSSQVPRG